MTVAKLHADEGVTGHRLAYREDIDGLRAIAVLSVVLYHANLGVSGGYVGVDVFFVISGFLITSLISKDLLNGTFRFSDFWERRARRILPAMVVMVVAVLTVGAFLMLPREYETLGKATIALSLFAANIFMWRQSNNYFAESSEENPLLHTWSLAVEEQFYFFVPVLMWAAYRMGASTGREKVLRLFTVGFVLSFGLSIYGVSRYPGAAFYLLPTRAWELIAGAIVAHVPLSDQMRGWGHKAWQRGFVEFLAVVSLAGIILPTFYFDSRTPFPGFNALPPCLGAALLIWVNGVSGRNTAVARLLSCRPMVVVGLLSYSLYLWHWPILAYYRLYTFQGATGWVSCFLVSLSFACAFFSWRYVETPFRKRTVGVSKKSIFAYSAISLALFVASGGVLVATGGLPERLGKEALRFVDASMDFPFEKGVDKYEIMKDELVHVGVRDGQSSSSVLVWGDSHAQAVLPAVEKLLEERGLAGKGIVHAATPPILKKRIPVPASQLWDSDEYSKAAIRYVERNRVPVVILAGYWQAPGYGSPGEDGIPMGEALKLAVREIIKAGAEPWVFLDVPVLKHNVPKVMGRHFFLGGNCNDSQYFPLVSETDPFDGLTAECVEELEKLGAVVIDPKPAFLDSSGSRYVLESEGIILYRDRDHLTGKGAVKMILPLLREAWTDYERRKAAKLSIDN